MRPFFTFITEANIVKGYVHFKHQSIDEETIQENTVPTTSHHIVFYKENPSLIYGSHPDKKVAVKQAKKNFEALHPVMSKKLKDAGQKPKLSVLKTAPGFTPPAASKKSDAVHWQKHQTGQGLQAAPAKHLFMAIHKPSKTMVGLAQTPNMAKEMAIKHFTSGVANATAYATHGKNIKIVKAHTDMHAHFHSGQKGTKNYYKSKVDGLYKPFTPNAPKSPPPLHTTPGSAGLAYQPSHDQPSTWQTVKNKVHQFFSDGKFHPQSSDEEEKHHHKLVAHYQNYDSVHKGAIHYYCGSGASQINKKLWHAKKLNNYEETHRKNLLDTTKQHTAPEDFHVYSGIKFDPSRHPPNEHGKIHMILPAFSSTTVKYGTAHGFAHTTPNGAMNILRIHVPKGAHGAYVGHISQHKSEREFILPQNTQLHIEKTPVPHHLHNKVMIWNARIVHDGTNYHPVD